MEQLHRASDKLLREVEILEITLESLSDEHEDSVALAVAQAKRVRRDVTILLKELAILRDKLQA